MIELRLRAARLVGAWDYADRRDALLAFMRQVMVGCNGGRVCGPDDVDGWLLLAYVWLDA